MNSTINKSINASKIICKHQLCNIPITLQVRGHVGYLPAEGRLHPWETEEARTQKQIKRLNLQPVKRMHFSFDPFHESAKSIRHLIYHFSSEKVRGTNPKCVYKTDILSDRSEPTINVHLDEKTEDLNRITFKTANLKAEDVLTKFNEMILPFIKVEVTDERTTKGAKAKGPPKATPTAKKKK